jgi:NOL1/NOP2/fmu family ribosome biogenesis protein
MRTSSTSDNFKEEINFNFNTTYMGEEITLQVISNKNLYSVLHNNNPIGNIKLGYISNTWYVIDRNYAPGYLVDEIGNRIQAEL